MIFFYILDVATQSEIRKITSSLDEQKEVCEERSRTILDLESENSRLVDGK